MSRDWKTTNTQNNITKSLLCPLQIVYVPFSSNTAHWEPEKRMFFVWPVGSSMTLNGCLSTTKNGEISVRLPYNSL